MFYYNIIEMSCLFLLLVFTANLLLYSNVVYLCNLLLDCFQQYWYMLKFTKNFFSEPDLLKWGCVLCASAFYMPSNMVSNQLVGQFAQNNKSQMFKTETTAKSIERLLEYITEVVVGFLWLELFKLLLLRLTRRTDLNRTVSFRIFWQSYRLNNYLNIVPFFLEKCCCNEKVESSFFCN